MKKDKRTIVKCYEANIEYFRLNPKAYDVLNVYIPYADEYNNIISIDSLIYRPDSLMAFTFILITDTLKSYYDANAIICYRKKITDVFQIYPVLVMSILHFDNAKDALEEIKYFYQNELRDQIDRWHYKYNSNLGDPDFWSKSLYFKRINGRYYFELYYKPNNFEPEYGELNYVKCNCQ